MNDEIPYLEDDVLVEVDLDVLSAEIAEQRLRNKDCWMKNYSNDNIGDLRADFRKLRREKKLNRDEVAAKCWSVNARWVKLFETGGCEASIEKVCDVFSAIGEEITIGKLTVKNSENV